MTKPYDVLVVGAGLSGSMAALFAAARGKSVLLMSRGAGALTIGGGTIDLLACLPDGTPLGKAGYASPFAAMAALPAQHPYRLAGAETAAEACTAFAALCARNGYPYTDRDGAGSPAFGAGNTFLPTTAGTLKPSWLVPASMSMSRLRTATQVVLVGVEGLKDVYPQLMTHGLQDRFAFRDKELIPVMLASPFDATRPGRDPSLLDLARLLDTAEGQRWFVEQLRQRLAPDALAKLRENGVVLVPPILGATPSTTVREALHEALGVTLYEVVAPPPGVTGWRLSTLLRAELKRAGVQIMEQARAVRAQIEDGRCTGVVTCQSGRERTYRATSLILATGGLYGEGLASGPDSVTEALFGWQLPVSPASPEWSADRVYSSSAHGFATVGVSVNNRFNPVDATGRVLFDNVFVVGRTLGHYDHAKEKSGNGVALVTAWAAAKAL